MEPSRLLMWQTSCMEPSLVANRWPLLLLWPRISWSPASHTSHVTRRHANRPGQEEVEPRSSDPAGILAIRGPRSIRSIPTPASSPDPKFVNPSGFIGAVPSKGGSPHPVGCQPQLMKKGGVFLSKGGLSFPTPSWTPPN